MLIYNIVVNYLIQSCILSAFSVVNSVSFYEILEIGNQATLKEIKNSYKYLARKWHPDYNKSKKSNEMFYLVNEAFKTLSDPYLRSMYDLFGKGSSELDFFLSGESLIEGDSFSLSFPSNQIINILPSATNSLYDSSIKQQSYQQLQLLFVGGDKDIEDWVLWANKLSSDGIRTYHIDSIKEIILLRRLRFKQFSNIACMGCMLEGKVQWKCPIAESYKEIKAFIVHCYPISLALSLTNNTLEKFLHTNAVNKNHVSMLLFGHSSSFPPLSFLASLFPMKKHITGAYIFHGTPDGYSLFHHFNLPLNTTSLLVFKEDYQNPVFKFSLPEIASSHYRSIIKTHSTLQTPRISSPHVFDLLCPINTSSRLKSLCVLLLRQNDYSSDEFLNSFRLFSQDYLQKDRVKFAYVSLIGQKSFVHLFTWGQSPYNSSTDSLTVVILWRKEGKTLLNFEVLDGGWGRSGAQLRRSRRRLTLSLQWLLNHPNNLPNIVQMRIPLNDEHLSNIWIRMAQKVLTWLERLVDFLLGVEDSTYMMLIKSSILVLLGGSVISYLHKRELMMLQQQEHFNSTSNEKPNEIISSERPVIQLFVLGAHNYTELVLKSPPSMRLILLLVNSASKESLSNYFASFILPYSRSKAFRFAIVNLDNYINWYRQVLDLTLRQSSNEIRQAIPNINAKNCLGTVLAINGIKKYYFMYHISNYKSFSSFDNKCKSSDMEESDDDERAEANPAFEERRFGMNKIKRRITMKGHIEYDSNDESDFFHQRRKYFEVDLLRGLGRWMERMVEGKLKKFKLTDWPASMS